MEVGYYLPQFLYNQYGITKTRWVIVRNSYRELKDTTQKTVEEWFPDGRLKYADEIFTVKYDNGVESEMIFRSCDRAEDVKKFKSLEVTGYWIDESIEVADDIKRMLKNRIGRYPSKCPVRFGIETTNPPDVENPTYSEFKWNTLPPGPMPSGNPKENHVGFWQPPGENDANLRPGYYDDLRKDYIDSPDWVDTYIDGKPGIIVKGKLVYNNFRRNLHVSREPLIWSRGTIYRGWDNSGNCPACIIAQMPTFGRIHVLREFHTDKQNIVDFTRMVITQCHKDFPKAIYADYGDPAGANKFSKREGGFTSNAQLQLTEGGITVISSDQNLTARISAVEESLKQPDGLLIDLSCTRLINGFLGGYCCAEIGHSGIYRREPEKNRFSHIHDALQYLLVKLIYKRKKRYDR
jgi:hypothetical protein